MANTFMNTTRVKQFSLELSFIDSQSVSHVERVGLVNFTQVELSESGLITIEYLLLLIYKHYPNDIM